MEHVPGSQLTAWTTIHRVNPQLLWKVKAFLVFGESGTELLLLTLDDTVLALGLNQWGSLGLGHKSSVDEPCEVVELSHRSIREITHGTRHVVALTTQGDVYTWGDNRFGQLGTSVQLESLKPMLVGSHITAVACGANHTLTLTDSGQVFAWGRNNYGQIGVGHNTDQLLPIKVTALDPHIIVAITCGSHHSMALTEGGELYAWGGNSYGQLGVGNCTHQTMPTLVKIQLGSSTGVNGSPTMSTNISSVKAMACGEWHSLVLLTSGELFACGKNDLGQLGSPSVVASEGSCVAVRVSTSIRFECIASHLGTHLSAGLSSTGYCYVWGDLSTEMAPVREPRQTPLTSLADLLAIYSRHRSTPNLVRVQNGGTVPSSCSNRIVDKLARSFDDPASSDLEFRIHGQSIFVHRWFLSISSKYLERMLSDCWLGPPPSECKNSDNMAKMNTPARRIVDLHDYPYTIYRAYLRYLYTDCLEIDPSDISYLLDLANCFLEDELKTKCIKLMRHTLSTGNCCYFYQLAVQYGLEQLERDIVTFALNNLFEVCRSTGFRAMASEMCKELVLSVSQIA